MPDYLIAFLLGVVEGLTEFIPVSSTGHLILLGHFLGLESAGTFDVLIQLGAILAILLVYFQRLVEIAMALPRDRRARHFVLSVLFAFLPAAVIGALAHDFIKSVLFETPMLICIVLVLGGIVLLVVDKLEFKPRYHDVMDISWPAAIGIGFCQCLAMIPGTSRSGATIVGALLLGADKRSAAEFSFFLAMPTMVGAFTLDLYKSRNDLSLDQGVLIAIGFVTSFVTALFVVRRLLAFVSQRGYSPFGWWRIAVGLLGAVLLLTVG
ncbi:undecaprenyl-diphosphate phosphatase [Rhizobium sp. XQZ8]|uniref:undecaprenyl-diphosphate phosphatase n=1 Tax=Rhizobium populisoli TaxID=2859785 RepID=UPI001CA4EA84|nr:undecaprenyl-diphosphate phosphatase [Rhizobium populisoli]MBW6421497.1 undecaprenyl-diphosphate phosphatase [Rhizobium populisoli]